MLSMLVSMQISHIMIMILMFFIQHYIKITGIDPGFHHTADLNIETFYRKTL